MICTDAECAKAPSASSANAASEVAPAHGRKASDEIPLLANGRFTEPASPASIAKPDPGNGSTAEPRADPELAQRLEEELGSVRRYAVFATVAAIVSVLIGAVTLLFMAHLHNRMGKQTPSGDRDDRADIPTALDAIVKRHVATLSAATTDGLKRIERQLEWQRTSSDASSDLMDNASPTQASSPLTEPGDPLATASNPTQVARPDRFTGLAPSPAPSGFERPAERPTAMTRAELGALMSAIRQAIRTVAETGSPITAANVATRIASAMTDESQRAELARAGLTVEFYDSTGRPSSQATDLMAICLEAVGGSTRFVFPFPYAGKVARYVYWFGQGDYKTGPVLAELPATAEVGTDGLLTKTKNGMLRKT
ncbi:hypothetical protein [Caballeronia sp. DA-9]|uniref:hypothetical protein n=1 Tax=Caballeronia sp. DA-9 TaxID=3436237 RepID=UPI003F667E77